jgi:molecular chaperone Hsp33
VKPAAARDLLHVFVFEHIAVRGALVQLDDTWRYIRSLRAYPQAVETLLGESIVAAALLASTLKSESGNLLLQIQGDGPVRLLVAECSSELGLRCTARCADSVAAAALTELIGHGRCAITVGATDDARRYQGIVPLDRPTLAGVLESYMQRSEQLATRILLFADAQAASGLLLQRIPGRSDADSDGWNRLGHLAATVSADELRALSAAMLLRRLFPEDDLRLFGGRPLRYQCSCSRERVAGMLVSLGREEVEQVIAEQGQVEVTCEFCGRSYTFTAEDARGLFDA